MISMVMPIPPSSPPHRLSKLPTASSSSTTTIVPAATTILMDPKGHIHCIILLSLLIFVLFRFPLLIITPTTSHNQRLPPSLHPALPALPPNPTTKGVQSRPCLR